MATSQTGILIREHQSVVLEVSDVEVDYDQAFTEVIWSRWNKTPEKQKDAATRPDRQGQLEPDAPDSYALYDTFNYQRGHADVFRKAYKQALHSPPKKGERLLVVDIGAGAATVAVALGEALKQHKRKRVDYLAFDPNRMMRKLGRQLLENLDPEFRSAKYISSLDDVDFANTDRLLFTFSYVTHQDAVAQADKDEWANLIKRAVDEVGREVELIYTTANLSGGAHLDLERKLRQANILRKIGLIDVQVRMRYPRLTLSDGQISWNKYIRRWKVQAGHWTLSA